MASAKNRKGKGGAKNGGDDGGRNGGARNLTRRRSAKSYATRSPKGGIQVIGGGGGGKTQGTAPRPL